jgi:ribosomal protein S18 acetylase RimI-like enzyme
VTFTIRAAEWPRDEPGIMGLDASYQTDRVYRVERGPLSFRLELVPVEPAHRGLVAPLSEEIATLRAAPHAAVAEEDGRVLGVAAADVEWSGRTRVQEISVAAAARGRGVGRALMDSVVAFARARGSRCVWLETQAANYPAIELYQRYGFTLCGLDERFYEARSSDVALFFALGLPEG